MKTFAENIIDYYRALRPPTGLPAGVHVLYPYEGSDTIAAFTAFFRKYYNDTSPRRLILGINPGRFGAGTTGINFTAPRQLTRYCGIENPFKDQSELSAEFIYDMIMEYGGPETFYGDYFIGAVSPLGYVKNGVNMNYYDDKVLLSSLRPFIVDNIKSLIGMGFETSECFCIGEDKNFRFLSELNKTYGFFNSVKPLPHPRFIMQYKRKQKHEYVLRYLDVLKHS